MKVFKKEEVVEKIHLVLAHHQEVLLAYLFGSVAEKGRSAHDVDIALILNIEGVWPRTQKLAELTQEIAKTLQTSEEKLNIIDLSDVPLGLKYNILTKGVLLVDSSAKEEIRAQLLREYPDFLLSLKIDPSSKPERPLLVSRVEELRRNIGYLEREVLSKPLKVIVSDYKEMLAMERAIHRALEAIFDICRHLVAIHNLGLVESYAEYPERLGNEGIMSKELSQKLKGLAGLRNILVHRYLALKYEVLYKVSEELVRDIYSPFLNWVKQNL